MLENLTIPSADKIITRPDQGGRRNHLVVVGDGQEIQPVPQGMLCQFIYAQDPIGGQHMHVQIALGFVKLEVIGESSSRWWVPRSSSRWRKMPVWQKKQEQTQSPLLLSGIGSPLLRSHPPLAFGDRGADVAHDTLCNRPDQ